MKPTPQGHFEDPARESFRQYVEELVSRRGMSVRGIEQYAGLPEGTLRKLLKAQNWIGDDNIERLADYFKVPFIEMWRRSRGKPLSPKVTPEEVAEIMDADPTMEEMFMGAKQLTPEAREEINRLIRFRLAELMEEERRSGKARERPRGARD